MVEKKKVERKEPKTYEIQVSFDKNSRKGTYHRYQIQPNQHGMVGTLYFNAGKDVPDEVIITVLV